jgi:hypothetical protein
MTKEKGVIEKALHAGRPLLVGLISEQGVPEQWKVEEYASAIEEGGGTVSTIQNLSWYEIINTFLPRIDLLIVDASSTDNIENVIAITTLAVMQRNIPVLVVHDDIAKCSSFYYQFEISRTGKKETDEYPQFPKFRKFFGGSVSDHKYAISNFVKAFKNPQCKYFSYGVFPEIDLVKPVEKVHEPVAGC